MLKLQSGVGNAHRLNSKGFEMLTDREMQTLRNTGNEAEAAADEIDCLNLQRRELQAEVEALKARLSSSHLDLMRDLIKQGWTAPLLTPVGVGDGNTYAVG